MVRRRCTLESFGTWSSSVSNESDKQILRCKDSSRKNTRKYKVSQIRQREVLAKLDLSPILPTSMSMLASMRASPRSRNLQHQRLKFHGHFE
jgi:hypothetical protein